jgi:hypothetical protein
MINLTKRGRGRGLVMTTLLCFRVLLQTRVSNSRKV